VSRRLEDFQHVAEVLDAHERAQADIQSQAAWAVDRDPGEAAALEAAERERALAGLSPSFAAAKMLPPRTPPAHMSDA